MKKKFNIAFKPFFKRMFFIIFLFLIYFIISAYSYASTVSQDLSDAVFRLHVIANSDSKEDQDLKYLVRDNILDYMNTLCSNACSKEESIRLANEHLTDFKHIAKKTIEENGYNYDVNVKIGNFYFPNKQYR